jgi:hypothetical protein
VVAVGTGPNPVLLSATPGLEKNGRGYVVVDEETGETSIPNVFAGGDIVTGSATVILAMGAGRRAAKEIARRLLVTTPDAGAGRRRAALGHARPHHGGFSQETAFPSAAPSPVRGGMVFPKNPGTRIADTTLFSAPHITCFPV